MAKTNLQIRLEEEIAAKVDEMTSQSRSSFVREAIVEKLRREQFQKSEDQWIAALKKEGHPCDATDKEWLDVESWEDE